uniref:Zinc finger protein n=1 Tax=Marseillevirus LCMAC201 TaxID=2506605 RepID=A0A481YVE8_9VIRU|nr:MAG: zinc finger protein [Marseillevirus LCMAC201]
MNDESIRYISQSITANVCDPRTVTREQEKIDREKYLEIIDRDTWKEDIITIGKAIEQNSEIIKNEKLTRNLSPNFQIVGADCTWDLNQSVVVIGRKDGCDVQIKQDFISRVHLLIFIWDQMVLVVDPGSLNGIKSYKRVDQTMPLENSIPDARKVLKFGRSEAYVLDLSNDCYITASPKECVICFTNPRQIRLNCNHFIMCRECCDKVKQNDNLCPLCRTLIIDVHHEGHMNCMTNVKYQD